MMPGLDPKQMAAMQEVSKHIKSTIRVDYNESTVHISFVSDEPNAQVLIPQLLEQFSGALAQQLSSFFAITGEIVEVGKKS